MEVNPDRASADGVPVRWCETCRAFITYRMHLNQSCHGLCRYCHTRVPHDTCRDLGSNIINYTTRATQTYPSNLEERDREAFMRHLRLPADSYSTMIIHRRPDWNPNAIHVATTAPLEDWSKGFPPIVQRSITQRTDALTTPAAGSTPVQSPYSPAFVDLTAENSDTGTVEHMDEQEASASKQGKPKRKHLATGKPRGRPPKDPKPDGDPDKGRGLA